MLTSIVDLRGEMARMLKGTASYCQQPARQDAGREPAAHEFLRRKAGRYKNGCLYVGDEIIRRRKI